MSSARTEKYVNLTDFIYQKASMGDPILGLGVILGQDKPLHLDCGVDLGTFRICYTMHGELNKDKSNVILVCHALTGDQFIASPHPISKDEGWWGHVVGPGKYIDTEKYCVVCSNILGGCMGSAGPADMYYEPPDLAGPKLTGPDFPNLSIRDMIRAQKMLADYLGIKKWHCVVGGSMGGMQALQWAASFPEMVGAAAIIAASSRMTAQNIAINSVTRNAIVNDPNWRGGRYRAEGTFPAQGLALSRRIAFISYLSEALMEHKFGRSLQTTDAMEEPAKVLFQIESYLGHQGNKFVKRFDANSYMYITRAMDNFDLAWTEGGGILKNAFRRPFPRLWVCAFDSDWLFPPEESKVLVEALEEAGAPVAYDLFQSVNGHDAFLLSSEVEFLEKMQAFIESA